jgi:hypothetical protein
VLWEAVKVPGEAVKAPGEAVKAPGEAVKVGGEGGQGCCRWSGKVTGKGTAVVEVCTGEETAGKKFHNWSDSSE